MTFGRHARVGQDLRNGVPGRRRFLAFVSFAERLDEIERVVVADVLKSIGDALDQVFLFNGSHFRLSIRGYENSAIGGDSITGVVAGSWVKAGGNLMSIQSPTRMHRGTEEIQRKASEK